MVMAFFSATDDQFGQFQVWRDRNGNGRSDRGELLSLSDAGIASVNLTGTAVNRDWGWSDNLVINTGSFTRIDGSQGALGDVALNYAADIGQQRRDAISLSAGRFAEAIAAFATRGSVEFSLGKHDMQSQRELVASSYHFRI
jgi:hypothetical protein